MSFFAPGRVNLIGEHTDYTGGFVLPVALGLGVTIDGVAAERIELESDGFGAADVDARGEEPVAGWARYVAAVAAELDALGRPPVGLRGTVSSTLPAGAGLSSSAALEVAIGHALCAVAAFDLPPVDLVLATQRAEERAVGVPCGVMDQAAAVFGQPGHALLIDTGSLGHRPVELPDELEIVVFDSGVRRRLEDSRYAERRAEVERGDPRRLRHISTENERVLRATTALERTPPDLAELACVFAESHASLRDDFEVSTPELDDLVARALRHGAVAARLTGGGFGGSVVALAERGTSAELIARVGARGAFAA